MKGKKLRAIVYLELRLDRVGVKMRKRGIGTAVVRWLVGDMEVGGMASRRRGEEEQVEFGCGLAELRVGLCEREPSSHLLFISNKFLMASNLNPAYAYTVVYVKDVAKSVAFYAKAFGYNVRRLDQSHRWGELESGHTTIAFTPAHQRETDEKSGSVQKPVGPEERQQVEVCFAFADVDAAYKTAVDSGAVAVCPPEDKEWGQRVGYVRDIDGIVVRLGSYVKEPSSSH
ncbi:hypothetical protein IEQ34_009199 [Dendrobium chrysotoxum]|uniref:VOC domain-containing protein n=1 Tax=Dendrobium chrysotoxum TaxID=161865 RepID=A0AAV7GIL0_DENCH|nr:hypothetical protein IEQ34_009199 [Dendrobium chrysotoxum]